MQSWVNCLRLMSEPLWVKWVFCGTGHTAQQVIHHSPRCYPLLFPLSFHLSFSSASDPLLSLHLWARHSTANCMRVFQVSHASSSSAHIQLHVYTKRDTHLLTVFVWSHKTKGAWKTCENPSVKSMYFAHILFHKQQQIGQTRGSSLYAAKLIKCLRRKGGRVAFI